MENTEVTEGLADITQTAKRLYLLSAFSFELLASEQAFDVVQTAFGGEKAFLTAFEFDADEAVETALLDDGDDRPQIQIAVARDGAFHIVAVARRTPVFRIGHVFAQVVVFEVVHAADVGVVADDADGIFVDAADVADVDEATEVDAVDGENETADALFALDVPTVVFDSRRDAVLRGVVGDFAAGVDKQRQIFVKLFH